MGLFFKIGALEFVVKILDKCTSKEFLKINSKTDFFHRNFSRILMIIITTITWQNTFSKTPVTVTTKIEVFQKDSLSKSEDIGK